MIYTKTQLGQTAFQNRSVPLTPRQRSTFILFDGKRQLSEVMTATAGMGVTAEDVGHLVTLGLLAPALAAPQPLDAPVAGAVSGSGAAAAPGAAAAILPVHPQGLPTLDAQAHFLKAYPIATRLTAGLGLRGFRLNLAVEAAGDLGKLKELAPRIQEAVGAEKFRELQSSLYD